MGERARSSSSPVPPCPCLPLPTPTFWVRCRASSPPNDLPSRYTGREGPQCATPCCPPRTYTYLLGQGQGKQSSKRLAQQVNRARGPAVCQLILEELGNVRDQLVEGRAVGGGDEQGAQVEAVEQVGEL